MSSGTFLLAIFFASSARLRARPVSWSSRILRPTDSGSASGPRSRSASPWFRDGCCATSSTTRGFRGAVSPTSRGSWATPKSCATCSGSEIDAIGVDHLGRCGQTTEIAGGGVDGRADAELLEDPLLDLVGEVGVVLEELAGVLLALTELVTFV